MGENLNPLDELKNLDQQVDRVTVLEDLKPIFFRLDEIAKANANDFEVQLVVGDIKQHLVNRGTKLKDQAARAVAGPAVKPAPGAGVSPPPLPPSIPAAGPPRSTPPAPPAVSNVPPQGSVSSDAPTVILTPRPQVRLSAPPIGATTPTATPRSPLEGPAPLSQLRPPAELKPSGEVKPPVRLMSSGQFSSPPKPPDVIPSAPPIPPPPALRTVTPPQSTPSAPPPFPGPGGPPPISPPAISKPPSAEPPGSPATLTLPMVGFGSSKGPLATGPQTPPGAGAAPPAGPASVPPRQPPQPPSSTPTSRPAPQGAGAAAKPPARQSMNWKRALLVGAMLGALVAVVGIAFLVNLSRKHNKWFEQKQAAEMAAVQVQITTTPANASVRVNGETKCTAPCAVALAPGSYQVMAFLDGYDPATSALNVVAGQPGTVTFTLTPQPQTVRILTDLDQGQIVFDDQAPADLQEGQFIVDNVAPGSHTVKVTAKSGDATFTFDIAEAKPPAVTGTIAARNLIAVLVSSFANQARVVTNSGPLKLAVNGQAEGDAGPEGVDLKAFQPGVDELVVGDGKDQRNMKESFGPGPMLTAFVKSDLNIGTLIVSTGEDDVRVYINDKEYRRRTARGQLRIPAIGKVKVAVYKDGFQIEPAQNTEVKKGAEVRLEFKLKAMPVMTTLQIRGGAAGTEVWIDLTNVGTVAPDGTFTYSSVAPGDHAIELRRDQYTTKRIQRTFRTGQPVALTAADVTLVAAAPTNATIRIARTPANATVTYKRADETEAHELRAPQLDLPAGAYVFSSKAPGYADRTDRVQIAAGESRTLEIALTARPTAPAVKNGDVADFEEAGAWKKEGELFVHKGGGFVPYKLGPRGTYTFTVELVKGGGVFRGGRIRWAVQYLNSKDYLSYEMDRKTFWAYVVEKGKKLERQKTPLQLDNGKTFTIQIEITPDHCVHKLKTGDAAWLTLDSFAEPGRNFTAGKFGFLIQGNDEIGISDFTFSPK